MLRPNGVYLGTMFGGDTLQELWICLNLGEKEREGGLSAVTSPQMQMTTIGNIFARANFSLPTIDRTQIMFEFPELVDLIEFLQINGDTNTLTANWFPKDMDTFIAASAIYSTLFNTQTVPWSEWSTVFDTFNQQEGDKNLWSIISTIDMIFLLGWKPDAS